MPLTTASAAVHITPVVFKTFIRHTRRKGHKLEEGDKTEDAYDDIFYDEAFHIVKAFIELGTKNTVESLQEFTNTHVPAPFWCAVVPVKIPLASCNQAADSLIEWFGPDELKRVVGGERWWQIRGLDWLQGEWVTQKEYLRDCTFPEGCEYSEDEKTISKMEHLDRVMLYVHGGAFFWGSVNTHRYQIIRYARKIQGRAFAVNYRKAPQYPWPCPLQDVLAAYFYLTNPPPGAVHKPVPPSKLVLAGDSAGASLCLTLLTVLRDLGLAQPAGAVLISPWVDLTHSFPSVMSNTTTDIIPPHGFIHKPSTLWPVHPKPESGYTRAVPTKTEPPPQPGHADTLKPDIEKASDRKAQRTQQGERGVEIPASEIRDSPEKVGSQHEMLSIDRVDGPNGDITPADHASTSDAAEVENEDVIKDWEPKPPKVLMEDPNATPLELCAQIQLYATTEQLSHPLVSPALQSSLGNLCPLYILGGDGECLRDEIMYVAHKAAHPKDYPVRRGILADGHRQRENAEKFQTPTKVHLQIYDDMCHVLTVFTFTDAAKYAYRAIAQFVKHVTDNSEEHLVHNPFPISEEGIKDEKDVARVDVEDPSERRGSHVLERANDSDTASVSIIRERVNALGCVRAMEPVEEIAALRIPPQEIGLIKEKPVRRWLEGQEAWDKKYKHTAENVLRKRKHYREKAQRLLDHARQQGVIHDDLTPQRSRTSIGEGISSIGETQPERRWGPLDLKDERPPPSAIAGRRDTREAVALLKTTIYHSVPVSHRKVPKLKTSDAVRAALDPHDHPINGPQQSVSEQEMHTRVFPMHGLRIWQSLVELFMRKSTKKVENGAKQAGSTLRATREKLSGSSQPSTEGVTS